MAKPLLRASFTKHQITSRLESLDVHVGQICAHIIPASFNYIPSNVYSLATITCIKDSSVWMLLNFTLMLVPVLDKKSCSSHSPFLIHHLVFGTTILLIYFLKKTILLIYLPGRRLTRSARASRPGDGDGGGEHPAARAGDSVGGGTLHPREHLPWYVPFLLLVSWFFSLACF